MYTCQIGLLKKQISSLTDSLARVLSINNRSVKLKLANGRIVTRNCQDIISFNLNENSECKLDILDLPLYGEPNNAPLTLHDSQFELYIPTINKLVVQHGKQIEYDNPTDNKHENNEHDEEDKHDDDDDDEDIERIEEEGNNSNKAGKDNDDNDDEDIERIEEEGNNSDKAGKAPNTTLSFHVRPTRQSSCIPVPSFKVIQSVIRSSHQHSEE